MSITAVNLTDGFRVDRATQRGSVIDVKALVTGKKGGYVTQVFWRFKGQYSKLINSINGKGRETPVADGSQCVRIFSHPVSLDLCLRSWPAQTQSADQAYCLPLT